MKQGTSDVVDAYKKIFPAHVVDAHLNPNTREDQCLPYRLSDVVNGSFERYEKYFGTREVQAYMECHRDTIAGEYYRSTSTQGNVDELTRIVARRCPGGTTKETVVHLRLGDVLCHDYPQARARKPSPPETVADAVNELHGGEVVFVYGNHLRVCERETSDYIDTITSLVPGSRAETSGENADADFCRMVMADKFVQSTGGFSELVAGVRRRLGRPTVTLGRHRNTP